MFVWCLRVLLRLRDSHKVSSEEDQLLITKRGHELRRRAPPLWAALIVRFPGDPQQRRLFPVKEQKYLVDISQGAETPHRLLLADPDMRSLVAEKVIHVDPCPTFQYSRTLSANVKKRSRGLSRLARAAGLGTPAGNIVGYGVLGLRDYLCMHLLPSRCSHVYG